jgi:hypothetical protein
MGWTKREYILQAYEEIGLAAYVYDLTPEQQNSALRRLDAMMATWDANGINVGWMMPSTPDSSDIDFKTNVPDVANEAIYTNLAVRLSAAFGKVPSAELKLLAGSSYKTLLLFVTKDIPQRQMPDTMPCGAGNKPHAGFSNQFFSALDTPLAVGNDNIITLE